MVMWSFGYICIEMMRHVAFSRQSVETGPSDDVGMEPSIFCWRASLFRGEFVDDLTFFEEFVDELYPRLLSEDDLSFTI